MSESESRSRSKDRYHLTPSSSMQPKTALNAWSSSATSLMTSCNVFALAFKRVADKPMSLGDHLPGLVFSLIRTAA